MPGGNSDVNKRLQGADNVQALIARWTSLSPMILRMRSIAGSCRDFMTQPVPLFGRFVQLVGLTLLALSEEHSMMISWGE